MLNGSPLPISYSITTRDWNAEEEFTGSPKAILSFNAGFSRSPNPSIFISPFIFLFTIITVGSENAGVKSFVVLRNSSIMFGSSLETYSMKSSFLEANMASLPAHNTSPSGFAFSEATRFTTSPVPATTTFTLIPVSFSKFLITALFRLSLRAVYTVSSFAALSAFGPSAFLSPPPQPLNNMDSDNTAVAKNATDFFMFSSSHF